MPTIKISKAITEAGKNELGTILKGLAQAIKIKTTKVGTRAILICSQVDSLTAENSATKRFCFDQA